MLIGNSRWHWAIEKQGQWNFIHTEPDLKHLQEDDTPVITWAAVGPYPIHSLLTENKLNIEKKLEKPESQELGSAAQGLGCGGVVKRTIPRKA